MDKKDITFDLETVPSQNPEYYAGLVEKYDEIKTAELSALEPPKNIKDPAKIDIWLQTEMPAKQAAIVAKYDQKLEEEYRKTALDGALCEIVVIGWAIDNEPVQTLSRGLGESEADMIFEFYNQLAQSVEMPLYGDKVGQAGIRWCGHNILGFDLRVLFQRSVVHRIPPRVKLPLWARPWDTKDVFDTMLVWGGMNSFVSMEKLCNVFGIPYKGAEIGEEMDGSKVWDFVKDGRIEAVARYCGGDVERTRHMMRFMEPIVEASLNGSPL